MDAMTSAWSGATFRASSRFELKRFDELTQAQQEPLRELERDGDFYGLLLPRPPESANIKSIGRDTAALLRSLATPARLDAALAGSEDVVDLVLDGVLEIEDGAGFVCGADALPIVCGSSSPEANGLSGEALRYAADLVSTDAATLTTALYLYNRIPTSRFWKARFPNREAVLAHLDVDTPPLSSILEARWQRMTAVQSQGWIAWHPRQPRHGGEVTYKLYVGARPEEIREVFASVVRLLASFGGYPFKIGPDAAGLLRPDKMVIYFPDRETLDEVAGGLARALAGCRPHGVPFTAPVADGGVLSWGLDPPDSARALSWLGRESWRLWLATQLGAAIAFAKRSSARGSVEPWRFALERVRRMGVDVERWTPEATLWRSA
jgi:hypothetical protein